MYGYVLEYEVYQIFHQNILDGLRMGLNGYRIILKTKYVKYFIKICNMYGISLKSSQIKS